MVGSSNNKSKRSKKKKKKKKKKKFGFSIFVCKKAKIKKRERIEQNARKLISVLQF